MPACFGQSCSMRTAVPISLTKHEREVLRKLQRAKRRRSRVARRASVVLLAAAGCSNQRIAEVLGTDPHTVARWRCRFQSEGLATLAAERHRAGRPRLLSSKEVADILRATLHDRPPKGQSWSIRSLAERFGVNHMRVARVWKRAGVIPPVWPES